MPLVSGAAQLACTLLVPVPCTAGAAGADGGSFSSVTVTATARTAVLPPGSLATTWKVRSGSASWSRPAVTEICPSALMAKPAASPPARR